ncbi:MAG TPA: metal ABC transporter permease, partial [Miltoncostaeaceae bacterium]|nr:metal ABC transporter permease [Miltoncostaeaceae bacterium]
AGLLGGGVGVAAVTAFEAVGAILVVALLIVPAAAAHLLADRLAIMVAVAVMIGWLSALGGYWSAMALDASIAGAMGLWASGAFLLALLGAPRHGVIARFVARARLRRTMNAQRIALVDSRGVDR